MSFLVHHRALIVAAKFVLHVLWNAELKQALKVTLCAMCLVVIALNTLFDGIQSLGILVLVHANQ